MFQAGQQFTVLGKYTGKIVEINKDGVIYVIYEGSKEHHRWENPPAPYSYTEENLKKLIALKEGNHTVIPAQFRSPECDGWCTECFMPTHGICGHFLDARDYYGPFERINWMDGSFDRESYRQWVSEHFQDIRFVQECPNFMNSYPDGSLGTIPFLAKLAEQK